MKKLSLLYLLSFTEFHIIVCGLDSIIARRWMNGMLVRNASVPFILLSFTYSETFNYGASVNSNSIVDQDEIKTQLCSD